MRIGILGCGYLGSKIALSLASDQHELWLSTTQAEKKTAVQELGGQAVLLLGSQKKALQEFIAPLDLLFVTLASKSALDYRRTYELSCQNLKNILKNSTDIGPEQIIYTSSTGVYGQHNGQWVDEESPLLGKTPQNSSLIKAEKSLEEIRTLGRIVTILRLSQLYGEDRPLEKFVELISGSTLHGKGLHYTNFTHVDDATRAALYAAKHKLNGTYNVVGNTHLRRKVFYNMVCQHYGWPAPTWDDTESVSNFKHNKRVSSKKLKDLGFRFQHPLAFDWLDESTSQEQS